MSTRTHAAATHTLGVVSDLHVLSRYGLVPPQFRMSASGPSGRWQGYLWDCWVDFSKRCPPLDALIINGELTEGETPTTREALDAITDDPHLQGDAALMALRPLRDKTKHLWITRGTAFHEGKHFETIERLAQELGAEQWGPRRYTGFVLEREFYGVHVNATHHQTTGAIYRGTLADRTALFAVAAERLGKTLPADVIIRSHTHMKYLGKSHGKWVLMTPAWKMVTPYAIKRMEFYRASLLSDIGAVVMTVHPDKSIGWREFEYDPCLADAKASLTA